MIVGIAIFGLIIITLIILARYNWKLVLPAIVVLTYLGYYFAFPEVTKYFGYAIALNFTEMDQARFISGTMGEERIFILLIEKDKKEPRLVSIPNTEQNKKTFKELQQKAGKGAAVMRKGKKGDGKGKSGTAALNSHGDIEAVPMNEQEIIRKDG